MPDIYPNFAALRAACYAGPDYRIRFENRGGRVLVFSPHGGGIEPGASELVHAIAGRDGSYYLFEGRRSANNKTLHITSHHFDEPLCLDLLQSFETCLAIHGCDEDRPVIFIGGLNETLKRKLFTALSAKNYPARLAQNTGLDGCHPLNICNRTSTGAGVQLEFSTSIRQRMFLDLDRRSARRRLTPYFADLVAVIRAVNLS